jgi:hypothetical protein
MDKSWRICRVLLVKRPLVLCTMGLVLCICSAGCDPVRTTSQHVRIGVNRKDSGGPLKNASVSLKYFSTNKEFERFPWSQAETDENGEARIDIVYTMLDRTWGSTPPSWRDSVSNTNYVVKVHVDNKPDDINDMVITPGASQTGSMYVIHVIDVDKPTYVDEHR